MNTLIIEFATTGSIRGHMNNVHVTTHVHVSIHYTHCIHEWLLKSTSIHKVQCTCMYMYMCYSNVVCVMCVVDIGRAGIHLRLAGRTDRDLWS